MVNKVRAGRLSDWKENQAKLILVRGKEVAVFRRDSRFYALANQCPHQGGPLGEGFLDGDYVICPWHHWDFHLETGISRLGKDVCVRTYPVEVIGEEVFILERAT